MAVPPPAGLQRSRLRSARVADVLPSSVVPRATGRGIESAAVLVPGSHGADAYVSALRARSPEFAEWDGRLLVLPPDDSAAHRLLIVDRYGQVYWVADGADEGELPGADELREWFKFLATACPECGVLDDPSDRDWVP